MVPGCPTRATAADHIVPVHSGMGDDLFFGEGNLRAACRPHNLSRGFAAAAGMPDAQPGSSVVNGDYS